jgi:hemolysin III
MNVPSSAPEKPRLRGQLHKYAFIVSVPAGCILVATANPGLTRVTAGDFALSVMMLFGVSALYHCVQWQPAARAWMRRLDHASIYILISGTYTPVMAHTLSGEKSQTILALVWGISVAGIMLELLVKRVAKPLLALTYIGLGWVAIAVVSDMAAALSILAMTLLGAGGIIYTIGGIIYATKKPNPWPSTFGYHELFHLLVILGVVCHYAVVALYLRA